MRNVIEKRNKTHMGSHDVGRTPNHQSNLMKSLDKAQEPNITPNVRDSSGENSFIRTIRMQESQDRSSVDRSLSLGKSLNAVSMEDL